MERQNDVSYMTIDEPTDPETLRLKQQAGKELFESIKQQFKSNELWKEQGWKVELKEDGTVILWPDGLDKRLALTKNISKDVLNFVSDQKATKSGLHPLEKWFGVHMASWAIMKLVQNSPSPRIKEALRHAISMGMDGDEPAIHELENYTEKQWDRLLSYCEHIFRNFVVKDWVDTLDTALITFFQHACKDQDEVSLHL